MRSDNTNTAGFDLDKIPPLNLNTSSTNKQIAEAPKETAVPNVEISEQQDPLPDGRIGALPKIKLVVIASSISLVLVTAIALTISCELNIPSLFFYDKDLSKSEIFVSIGPLISSVDSGDLVKITIDVGCVKKSYQKKITDLDTEIRNRLIWAFQNSEAEKLMVAGDYFALRAYLTKCVMEVVPKDTVSEIYISELLRY